MTPAAARRMMNCRPPQTVRGPRRIAFAPALRGKAPRFRVRSAAFFARRLRRFFQVIFSKGTYNRKWYIVGRGAVLPRAGHLLDPVAPAAASPHPVGAGGLGGPFPSSSMPPAAPFLSAAKEMGERTPPKTDGFWISFRPISMRQEKAPQGIGHESTRAAADVVVTRDWRVYRFERLSNRALAANGGKCRCGPLGRRFLYWENIAPPRGAWERQRG